MRVSTVRFPLGAVTVVVLLSYLGVAYARICERDEFWSAFFNKCMNCTVCQHPDIVITPCQGHKDTTCGPLSRLDIDWSWMRPREHQKKHREKEMTETFKENMQEITLHEQHVKNREKYLRRLQKIKDRRRKEEEDDVDARSNRELLEELANENLRNREFKKLIHKINHESVKKKPMVYIIPEDVIGEDPTKAIRFNEDQARSFLTNSHKTEEHKPYDDKTERILSAKEFGFFTEKPENGDDYNDNEDSNESEDTVSENSESPLDPEVSEQEMDFSTSERLVLDYQAAVLYLALASIVVFFLVALCYSLKHLHTWGNYNYREDLEDLKSWLWTQSHKNNSKTMPSTIYKATTEVVSKQNSNYKYLERIITKNAKRSTNRVPQNVYQGAHPSLETRPLTAYTDDIDVQKPTDV